MKKVKKKPPNTPSKQEAITLRYEPFKCGICDVSTETREAIVAHCVEVHEVSNQYKCAFCAFSANAKGDVEKHCGNAHARYSVTVLKAHHVDPTTINNNSAGTGQQVQLCIRSNTNTVINLSILDKLFFFRSGLLKL